jgi:hypothetical protein
MNRPKNRGASSSPEQGKWRSHTTFQPTAANVITQADRQPDVNPHLSEASL